MTKRFWFLFTVMFFGGCSKFAPKPIARTQSYYEKFYAIHHGASPSPTPSGASHE